MDNYQRYKMNELSGSGFGGGGSGCGCLLYGIIGVIVIYFVIMLGIYS